MIIDPGAWMTMFGWNLARKLAVKCIANGKNPEQIKLSQPIAIAGVGNGQNHIHHKIRATCALPLANGSAKELELSAGVVSPPGDDLPGLFGMDILEAKRAILDVGNRRLILLEPDQGEVEMTIPAGATVTPLSKAPSGHLCMLLDSFANLRTRGQLRRVSLEAQPRPPNSNQRVLLDTL